MSFYGKTGKFEPSAKIVAILSIANVLYFVLLWYAHTSGRLPLFYGFLLSPFLLLLCYVLVFQRTIFVWILVAAIPFSVNINNLGAGVGLSIPGEIMLVMLAGIFIAENLIFNRVNKQLFLHPITIAVGAYLLWLLITLVFSSMPIISAKFVLVKFLFAVGLFLFFANFFQRPQRFHTFMWIVVAAMCSVIIFTTYKHSLQGFSFKSGFEIMLPFYENHGIYTATIAMILPFVLLSIIWYGKSGIALKYLPLLLFAAVVLLVGLVLGHSRASWISIASAVIFSILLFFRIRFSIMLTILVLVLSIVAWQNQRIMQELLRVNQTSNEKFLSHTLSSVNVTTDVSNAERINRWSCALRMFKDKPLFGFGPGTFTFQYGAYQIPAEQTRMSTPYPIKGDVHSEYLKALAEGGLIGFLTFFAVVLITIWAGMRLYYREKEIKNRLILLSVLLGLVTYFTHALVNNYLETDKAASLVWLFTAAIVALHNCYKSKLKLAD